MSLIFSISKKRNLTFFCTVEPTNKFELLAEWISSECIDILLVDLVFATLQGKLKN